MVIMIKDKYDILELLSDMLGADTLAEELVETLPSKDSVAAMKEIADKYDIDLNGVDDFLYIDDEE
jgi:hypothetical protein